MRALISAALMALVALPSASLAASPSILSATATDEDADGSSPFRGSTLTYRNAVTALTFDEGAELTYNPTWVMALEVAPRYWFDDVFSVGLRLDVSREITDDDTSTMRGESFLGNLTLTAGAVHWATIPVIDVRVSGGLDLSFPTSKAAQAQTMLFGVAPSVRLSRRFDVLAGLHLGYGLRLSKFFHRFTTSERETPLVPGCFDAVGGCESHLNSGVRNTSWRLTNSLDLTLEFTSWLSMSASVAWLTGFLYDAADDDRVNVTPQEPTSTRHALLYDLGVTVSPLSYFAVGLGTITINPQQRPDSSNYAPFFNRFTAFYLDLRLDVGALVASLSR